MKQHITRRLRSLALLLTLFAFACTSATGEEINTSASACIVIDAASGRTLLGHHAQVPLPMASTTKIMTALLALEQGDLDAPITCSSKAFGVPGTSIYLSQGETLSLRHMLYGLMLASGNDAATAIAEYVSGSTDAFCSLMTKRAAELGCTDTVFLTPHGLPRDGHYTTARDLALIAREAMTHPFFRELVSTRRAEIPWEGRSYPRVLNNKNKLLATYPGVTGIKTGYTRKAGRCLVFGAQRDDLEIIGVVLNCSNWFDEAARLMDLAFDRYEAITLLTAGETAGTIPVARSGGRIVSAVLAADLTAALPRGSMAQVEINLHASLEAPVHRGDVVGRARMFCGGDVVAEVPLLAADDIPRDDWPERLRQMLTRWPLLYP